MEYRTTDIRTGLFITFTLVAGTVLIFLMGGVRGAFRDAREIQAFFDNVRLLEREAPVTLGGFRVGEVASISRMEVTEPDGSKDYKVVVKMTVDRDLDLRFDARAMVKTDGFLGGKFVALTPGVSDDHVCVRPVIAALGRLAVLPGKVLDDPARAHLTDHLECPLDLPLFHLVGQARVHAERRVYALDNLLRAQDDQRAGGAQPKERQHEHRRAAKTNPRPSDPGLG